jgi:hypothetical protein
LPSDLLPAERTSALLRRCVVQLDGVDAMPAAIENLTVGDREALLLHLWRLNNGDTMPSVVRCPREACGEVMDVDLRVSELLQPPSVAPRPIYETEIAVGDETRTVRFRLPTGADQVAAARVAATDAEAGAALIVDRCVMETGGKDEPRPRDLLEALEARMETLDPQAELRLNLVCPACEGAFTVLFDAGAHLLTDIAGRLKTLYQEVHLLALGYHWSEAEILAMSTRKRRRYLELLLNGVPA